MKGQLFLEIFSFNHVGNLVDHLQNSLSEELVQHFCLPILLCRSQERLFGFPDHKLINVGSMHDVCG